MRIYRVAKEYEFLKVFDPYAIAIMLALKNGEKNISRTNLAASKYAEMTIATTIRKLKQLEEYGLVAVSPARKVAGVEEKLYKLTEKGERIIKAITEALGIQD
ncbi:MAG: winged helix-turn-helix transcriptional regulator [Candidatus Njordarchaeales archaeon]